MDRTVEPASTILSGPGADCVILFARTPVPGRVKSRLLPRFSPEQACALHCASTNDTAALLAETLHNAALWLFLSEAPSGNEANGLSLPSQFRCTVQEAGTLGERMGAAFERAFSSGARRVVIFGSDSPTLPRAVPPQAFEALEEPDMVLGPADDGGYYLIGCRRFDPALFDAVEWSTAQTCVQTFANARKLGYNTTLLQSWFDLDDWSDVERLLASARNGAPLPRFLAAFFQELDIV
jgi:uncharacterized protein